MPRTCVRYREELYMGQVLTTHFARAAPSARSCASQHRPSQLIHMARDDMVLVFRGQLAEVAAPAPYPHDQVLVPLRMRACIQQRLQAQAVQLKLLAAQLRKRPHQQRRLVDRLRVAENGVQQYTSPSP